MTQTVKVYKNLHNKNFTVKSSTESDSNANNFVLQNVVVNTDNSGVHFQGAPVYIEMIALKNELYFNSDLRKYLFKQTNEEFIGADYVYFNNGVVYIVASIEKTKNMRIKERKVKK